MSTPPILNGQHIGRAHYAVRALLEARLTATGQNFETWIPLNAVGTNGPTAEPELIEFVAGGLKISEQRARAAIAHLFDAGLLFSSPSDELALTPEGQALWEKVSAEVRPITGYLFEGLTDAEKSTVASVLNQVTERANAALAQG